jgi:hypothetical protein
MFLSLPGRKKMGAKSVPAVLAQAFSAPRAHDEQVEQPPALALGRTQNLRSNEPTHNSTTTATSQLCQSMR